LFFSPVTTVKGRHPATPRLTVGGEVPVPDLSEFEKNKGRFRDPFLGGTIYMICIYILKVWLVVLTILKNMKVDGKDYPIYYGKKYIFETTNQDP
jgi:hypothetical protein